VRETTLQIPRSVKKEGEGGAQTFGAESLPLHLMMETMVRQAVPLQSMDVHGGADIHLQPMEGTSCRSRWMPEGSCDPMGSPALWQAPARTCGSVEGRAHSGAGLLAGLVTLWGDPRWSSLFLKDGTLWESCIQLWSPQHRKDMDLLDWGQRRTTEMIWGWNPSAVRKG